jgi:hypothetical protein
MRNINLREGFEEGLNYCTREYKGIHSKEADLLKKIYILFILMMLTLAGCNKKQINATESNKDEPIKQVTNHNRTPTHTKNTVSAAEPPLRKDGIWEQLGARLYYIQGTVKSIEKNKGGKDIINLLVEKTFQNAGGAVSPYNNGEIYSFLLKDIPNVDFNQKKVIIYGGQVTSNDQDNFIGAMIVYYQSNKKFVDMNGKVASLPPKDYPFQF